MNEQSQQTQQNGFWAIVEIFGHQRIAGFLSEQTLGGQTFVRVDVPEIPAGVGEYGSKDGPVSAHSKMFGAGAIYAISPVDEPIARSAAQSIRHKPITAYGIRDALRNVPDDQRARLLAGPEDDGDNRASSSFE